MFRVSTPTLDWRTYQFTAGCLRTSLCAVLNLSRDINMLIVVHVVDSFNKMFVYFIYLSLQSLKCDDSFSPIGLEYIS